jgi:hypothetical protein
MLLEAKYIICVGMFSFYFQVLHFTQITNQKWGATTTHKLGRTTTRFKKNGNSQHIPIMSHV